MKKRILSISIALLVLAIVLPMAGYFYLFGRPHPEDPTDAVVSFEELRLFAEVHREAGGDRSNYQEQYFDLGSRAVSTWESQFDLDSAAVAEHVAEKPELYEDFGVRVAAVAATESQIRRAYAELERRYPEAVFSPLHVFFGGYSTRSLIRPFGILFAGEYFTEMPVAMDRESPLYLRGLVAEPEMIVSQAIHEQAHIQQARHSPLAMFTGTVLERAIYEGTADYVAELITGTRNTAAADRYVEEHGDALWCVFYGSLDLSYRKHWIDAERFGMPPGGIIGVFGYDIAKAYYEEFADPSDGLRALLELEDNYDEIFRRSGFAERLSQRCS